MDFKVGNIIKGKKGNGYGYAHEGMTKAKILQAGEDEMEIEYLEGDSFYIGKKPWVRNSKSLFELVNKKPTKQELLDMPIGTKITTDKGKILVKDDAEEIGRFENGSELLISCEVDTDLTIIDSPLGTKIVKVEVPTYITEYEEKETKEMTLKEIKEKLGYKIKIKGE